MSAHSRSSNRVDYCAWILCEFISGNPDVPISCVLLRAEIKYQDNLPDSAGPSGYSLLSRDNLDMPTNRLRLVV